MSKPYIYAPIPEFDQYTQYVSQMVPVDMGDHYFVGVEVHTASAVFNEDLENLLLEEMGGLSVTRDEFLQLMLEKGKID